MNKREMTQLHGVINCEGQIDQQGGPIECQQEDKGHCSMCDLFRDDERIEFVA